METRAIYVPRFKYKSPELSKVVVHEKPKTFVIVSQESIIAGSWLYGKRLPKSNPWFETRKDAYVWLAEQAATHAQQCKNAAEQTRATAEWLAREAELYSDKA